MGYGGRHKKTFRDGSYYAHVLFGKRTVKDGECAAIWLADGRRKLVEGPRRKRLFLSHIRFLDRYVADQNQYLLMQFRDGHKEHRRGPLAVFFDPCIHEKVEVKEALKLGANEAIVVYNEEDARRASGKAAAEGESAPATEVDAVGDPHDHILRIRNF